MIVSRISCVVVVLCASVAATGCGGSGQLPTARVTGKVTFNGQPVNGGNITFSPVAVGNNQPGKAATGPIGSDGSYTLTTYQQNDGAVVGRHKVTFTPPVTETEPGEGHTDAQAEAAAAAPKAPLVGLEPKTAEVEVKAGGNSLDIELTKPGA